MLTEILSCVETGTVDEVLAIIDRLQNLPEFGLHEKVSRVCELAKAVCDAELALAKARSTFRLNAEGLIKRVLANWTTREIEQATR